MTKDEAFHLDPNKLYKFTLYHGKEYFGILISDYANSLNYLVTIDKLKLNNESKLNDDEKVKAGIYIPINIATIDEWEEQPK
jgi:hypothetical protein